MQIHHLGPEDVELVRHIDRSEHITVAYRIDDGKLVSYPVDWQVPNWDATGTGEHSSQRRIGEWQPIVERGGVLLGAFIEEEFAGLAIVNPAFEPPMAWLAVLHVSRPHRRSGAAAALWAEAERIATASGADSMYVSATPSGSAVGFYQSRGCVLATPPHPKLLAMEPEDIHLIYQL